MIGRMKTIATGLWPRQARGLAWGHNKYMHGGKCVAYIFVDRSRDGKRRLVQHQVPQYEVRCPICPEQGQLDLQEEER